VVPNLLKDLLQSPGEVHTAFMDSDDRNLVSVLVPFRDLVRDSVQSTINSSAVQKLFRMHFLGDRKGKELSAKALRDNRKRYGT
jgi:hypothetical protein